MNPPPYPRAKAVAETTGSGDGATRRAVEGGATADIVGGPLVPIAEVAQVAVRPVVLFWLQLLIELVKAFVQVLQDFMKIRSARLELLFERFESLPFFVVRSHVVEVDQIYRVRQTHVGPLFETAASDTGMSLTRRREFRPQPGTKSSRFMFALAVVCSMRAVIS
jgi:hypothetical protein